MASTEHIIGIDLGTTNSVVAVIEGDTGKIIPNAEGMPKTPSTVAILENGDILTGEIARRQSATQPARTVSSAKRLIGRLKEELDDEAALFPFEIGEDEKGQVTIVIDGKAYSPEQISALILEKLKASAEEYLGEPVNKAIITVPAYFDDVQRQATLEAARIAGLEVLRLINEPTAAAMAYGLDKECQETVAIYDFGGGTFDFSALDIEGKTFEVLTSRGDSRLGGDDLDMALVDYVAERFLEENGVDLRGDYLTLRRMKDEVERVKCELSTSGSAALSLPFIAYVEGNAVHLEETITRETLEGIIEPFVEESIECCRQAMKDAGIRKSQIHKVIMVGGSTRIPLVQEAVEDFFGVAPFHGVNPDEVVAIGAAMQGAVLSGQLEEVVLLDVTPHTLSIEVKGDRRSILLEKNSTIPIKVERTFTTTEEDQTFVNIHLLQGDETEASENRSLGKFTLSNIPEAPSGIPRIKVEIFVNADGVVEVSANEIHSGDDNKLTSTFSYLNADEHRARRRRKRPKARTRRRAIGISEGQKKILESTPAAMPASDGGEEAATPQADGSALELARPAAPAEGDPGGTGGKSPADTDSNPLGLAPVLDLTGEATRKAESPPPESAPPESVPPEAAAADPTPNGEKSPDGAISQSPVDAVVDIEARAAAETAAVERPAPAPQAETPPDSNKKESPAPSIKGIPKALKPVVEFLAVDRSDDEATEVYEKSSKPFLAFCKKKDDDPAVQACRVKFLIFTRQPEEAHDALVVMRKTWPNDKREHFELYGLLVRHFPSYVAARRDRSVLAHAVGELKIAMVDLEFISRRDEADTEIFESLSRVYEDFLIDQKDTTIQFKLVKMHLRRGALDNAISLLQQMVQIATYRDRANKVLGLCFWQKGLRYLAFQKLKTLSVDEEVKELLYRLSVEMEEHDELLHAKYALERVYEADIGYKDTAERLKKLSYRIDLLRDENIGGSPGAGGGSGATTINESIIGGRFELMGEINRGSMGIVYRAMDRSLDEIVALKVLNEFLCADPESVDRFKKEARSARRLSHKNIVRIHDFMEIDDRKLISMEYIEGEDMKTILARNHTFTEEMLLYYLQQLCDGIAYAHQHGIVHRDIKPANIMIDERNNVKVTDFGIAKVLDSAATNNGTMIMGTPLYMSPEQIQGGRIDQRVDIYSLGIMLYEFVTGAPPFNEGSIEYQHLHNEIPEITAGISEGLKSVIVKCVQKNPDDRFQTVEEIATELRQLSNESRI